MANRGKNIFNSVKLKKPNRSTFNLSHDVKQSGRMGNLIPALVAECIPGDKWSIATAMAVRFAPLLAPVMHRFNIYMHYFFVPYRILWANFEEFIVNEGTHVMPYINVSSGLTADQKKFLDYMGVPPITGGNTIKINAMAMAAYQLIYNEYYRDQNLQVPIPNLDLINGDNSANVADLLGMRFRNLEHDYFTGSLPFAQKGAAVDIPLGDVILDPNWSSHGSIPKTRDASMAHLSGAITDDAFASGGLETGGIPSAFDPDGSLKTSSTTINDLRRAFRLQEWLERNALGGTRYIEHILAHFGVKSSDSRLQRPEYITGMKMPMIISEVLNTTGLLDYYDGGGGGVETTGSPVGQMSGHGIAADDSGRIGNYFCEEHGFVIGIFSMLPRTAYQQGLPKHYFKDDFLDYAFPEFANLGEQEVLKKEVYVDSAAPDSVFGYVPRYAEYKFMQSRVAGDFRTTHDYWHAGRIFGTEPGLNNDFIECNPDDYDRIFAVQGGADHLYMQIVHKLFCSRLLPFYGTPTI